MNRAQKITVAASTLVVVGLVALAAPAVASATGAVSAWARWSAAEQTAAPAPSPPVGEAATETGSEGVDFGDVEDDGLIYAGNGTWFSAEGPGDCATNAAIHPYGAHDPAARLSGELVDMGAAEHASGEVGYDADGLIETYTVAPGDSLIGIGERFCVDWVTVGAYNDRSGAKVIQPGDVLVLRP